MPFPKAGNRNGSGKQKVKSASLAMLSLRCISGIHVEISRKHQEDVHTYLVGYTGLEFHRERRKGMLV